MLPGIRLVFVAALVTAVSVMVALGVAGNFRIVRDTPISLVTSQTPMVEPALPRHLSDRQLEIAPPRGGTKGPGTRSNTAEPADATTANRIADPPSAPHQTAEAGQTTRRPSNEPEVAAPSGAARVPLELKPDNAQTVDQEVAGREAGVPDQASSKLDLPTSPPPVEAEPVPVHDDNLTSADDGPRTGAVDKADNPIPLVAAATSGQHHRAAFLTRSHSYSAQKLRFRARAARAPARKLPAIAAPEPEALFKRID